MSTAAPLLRAAPKSSVAGGSNLFLQRKCACGNTASGLSGECEECQRKRSFGLQPKLRVGSTDDSLEREADRVADQVMRMPEPALQRQADEQQDEELLQAKLLVQRKSFAAQESGAEPPASVHEVLRSPGQPLGTAERQYFEPRFGHDFGQVRVHANALAGESARAVNARAYTVGRNIAFAEGQYSPGTAEGKRLLAHELSHVVQQGGGDSIQFNAETRNGGLSPNNVQQSSGSQPGAQGLQRQPKTSEDTEKFKFMLGDVEGQQRVMSISSPSDPADFLNAFEEKGQQLIAAECAWLSNNLVQLVKDSVLKEKRDPFANLDVDTLRAITARGYDKAVAALAVYGVSEAGGKLLNAVHIGKKVLIVGEKVGTKLRTFGGVLAWVGSALIQALIGPLFDKSKELVKQAVTQFADAMQRVNNETIIPKVAASAAQFTKFMANLRAYLLQDEDEPKAKPKVKSESAGVAIGEGDYQLTVAVDTSKAMTEGRRDAVMLDLANVVLGMDAVMPTLKSDLSMYKELAVKAGIFSGKSTEATPPSTTRTIKPTYTKKFRFGQNLPGKTKFHAPKGATVIVESDARYDTDIDTTGMREDVRPPKKYTIELYRVSTSWRKGDRPEEPVRQFEVLKTQSAEWPVPDDGEYYLVLSKGGNPAFMLEGTVRIEVRPPGSAQK